MNLSAFGMETDTYPSIKAHLNFNTYSAVCVRSYYNPAFKTVEYVLSAEEVARVFALLQTVEIANLKTEYSVSPSDQPTSTFILQRSEGILRIVDYGLRGPDICNRYTKLYTNWTSANRGLAKAEWLLASPYPWLKLITNEKDMARFNENVFISSHHFLP